MKKLLILVLMIAATTACTREKTKATRSDRFEPKLTFGQEVIVATGFYKGSLIKIRSSTRCKEDGQGTYESDVVCYTATLNGRNGEEMAITNFAEREILGE